MARITEHPVPLHTLPNDVPEAMVELIRLSMGKSPAKRQMTAHHEVHALVSSHLDAG